MTQLILNCCKVWTRPTTDWRPRSWVRLPLVFLLDGGPGQPEIVIGNGPGGHPRVRVIYWPPAGPVQRLEILPLEIP